MWRTNRDTFGKAIAILFLFAALPAHAASTYASFSSVIDVNADASFVVTETIVGNFVVERHGIYRAIPTRYDAGYGLKRSIVIEVLGVTRDGEPEPYSSYREGDYQMIKLGADDVTFAGPFTYELVYRVERAMLYGESSDELYWNVAGDQWDEGFPSVGASVLVPGVEANDLSISCYTGSYGSTAQECVTQTDDGIAQASASDFLTVSVSFPKGIVAEPTIITRIGWWMSDNWPVFLLVIPFAVILWAVRHWRKYGRDPRGRGTLIAEYDPPKGLTPTETGTLVDAQLHDQDFSAAIVDLAVRGHLQIVEGEKKEYSLKRLRLDTEGLKAFERELMELLFTDGDEVKTKEHAKRFIGARKKVSELVYASMASDGYYVKDPDKVRNKYLLGATALIGLVFFALTPWTVAVVVPVAITFFVLAAVMPKRTEKGQEAFDRALGFKEYLSCAEKYRIEWQEKEGIFEKFLPYAMAFGVAGKWTKALAVQEPSAPSWYVGSAMAFSASDFGERLATLGSALGAVSAPHSSGGSGGGFSGGGFGGGGGGSW